MLKNSIFAKHNAESRKKIIMEQQRLLEQQQMQQQQMHQQQPNYQQHQSGQYSGYGVDNNMEGDEDEFIESPIQQQPRKYKVGERLKKRIASDPIIKKKQKFR